jgi:hypothetical protein
MKSNGLIQTNLFVAPTTDFAKVLQLRDVGCGAEGASLSVVSFSLTPTVRVGGTIDESN